MVAYVNSGTRSNSSGATSLAPALPASRVNGNLLIAIVGSKNNATHNYSGTGWTKLAQQNSGASWTVSIAWRIVDGSEAAPTASWTGSVAAFAQIVQYSGGALSPFGATNVNAGTTSTHSSTGVTTTKASSRVIYIDAAAANTALTTPSGGWTSNLDNGSATGATRNSVGGKDIATAGTGSGNISVTGASAAWVMWQLELLPTTFPVVAGSVATFADASGNVPLPSGVTAGDLLLVAILNTVGNTGLSPATGFQLLAEQFSSPHYQTVYWKIASGSEGTSQPFGSGAATAYMASLRITGHGSAGNAPEAAGANGSSATADPPAVTPGGGAKDYLWLEIAASIAGGVTGVSTSYTNEVATSDQTQRVGRRALNAASENPGTMPVTNGVWLAHTVAVYPSGGSVGLAATTTATAANSGALAVARPVAGGTTAASGSAAGLGVARRLAGAPAAASAASAAALRVARALGGASAASSASSAAITRLRALAGATTAIAINSGALAVARRVAGGTTAASGSAAAASVARRLAGAPAAMSASASALSVARALGGAGAALSAASAAIGRIRTLAGTTSAISAASAALRIARALAAIAIAIASAAGILAAGRAIASTAIAISAAAGALARGRAFAGGANAQSAGAGELAVDGQHVVALSGDAGAVSGAVGALAALRALAGAAAGVSADSGQLAILRGLAGAAAGATDADAQLAAIRLLDGAAGAVSHAASDGFVELTPFVPDPRRISRALHRPRIDRAMHLPRLGAAARRPPRVSIAEHRPRTSAAIHHSRIARARRS